MVMYESVFEYFSLNKIMFIILNLNLMHLFVMMLEKQTSYNGK